jgi:hypothetical protein
MTTVAVRPTKKEKASDADPLEMVAKKALVAYRKALEAKSSGNGRESRAEGMLLTAARLMLDCKQRVEGGEFEGTWEEFCATHFPDIEPDYIARLLDFVAPTPRSEVVAAADKLMGWLTKHVIASKHNHVVSTVWALASYYHKVTPVFVKLGYYAGEPASGKSTAAGATAEVADFEDMARRIKRTTAVSTRRRAAKTGKGVRIEDIHLYGEGAEIYNFIVNSFESDGVIEIAELGDQDAVKEYDVGGCPIIFTTNQRKWLPPEVARRCVLLPMMRSNPPHRVGSDQRRLALLPIRAAFANSVGTEWGAAGEDAPQTAGIERVREALQEPLPDWMDAPQFDRWVALFAVARALLDERWVADLENAARHLEDVTGTVSEREQLVRDLWEVRVAHPTSAGATPRALYEELRRVHAEWGAWTDKRFRTALESIYDAEGRELRKLNVPAHVKVVTCAGTKVVTRTVSPRHEVLPVATLQRRLDAVRPEGRRLRIDPRG